jgi:hypothetical protein
MIMKKIIKAPFVLDLSEVGVFETAKAALKSADHLSPLSFGWAWDQEVNLPEKFKLAVRVRFTRTDGRRITRRVLQTARYTCGYEEYSGYDYDSYYHPPRIIL